MMIPSDVMCCCYSLPDSPAEPDIEPEKKVTGEPKVIPHDEVITVTLGTKQSPH